MRLTIRLNAGFSCTQHPSTYPYLIRIEFVIISSSCLAVTLRQLERSIYVHRGLPTKNRDTVASRWLQFACQNGLTVGDPNFAGRNGTEALIGFAFSDCGDVVAVVRQSQRVYTTYIEAGSQRHKLQATSCSSRRNSICVKTSDA